MKYIKLVKENITYCVLEARSIRGCSKFMGKIMRKSFLKLIESGLSGED